MRVVTALAIVGVLIGTAVADVHGVDLPRGARAEGDRHASPLGFRATVDHFARQFDRHGIPVETVGPYRVRGVDVVRFVRTDAGGDWLAVHVYRTAGTTWIFVVARPTAAT